MSCFLVGDIGGTNSRLQLWRSSAEGVETLLLERIYPSQKYASLTFVIEKFLKEAASEAEEAEAGSSCHPVACCLAVAGPVRANEATITNVSWKLSGAEMSLALHIPDVLIVNDFVGVGYGLLALQREDVIPINDVPMAAGAPKVSIALPGWQQSASASAHSLSLCPSLCVQ